LNSITQLVLSIVTAIAFNALFVASEFSLARIRASSIHTQIKTGNFLYKLLHEAVEHLNDYISAAQIGVTVASLCVGAFAEPLFAHLLEPLMQNSWLSLHTSSLTISLFLATCLHVVFGEFIPKILSIQKPETIGLITILPLYAIYIVTKPLIFILNLFSIAFLRIFGLNVSGKTKFSYTEEEILYLIKQSEKEGIIEKSESDMVDNVFEFGETVVREIMTPRTEIVGLEKLVSIRDAASHAIDKKKSKLPVYEKDLDHIIGLIYSIDLLKALYLNPSNGEEPVQTIMREVMRIPESKPIADLLTEFRKGKTQMVTVVDEFGGTAGIVTLEDVIEEIVGDIRDEDEIHEEELIQDISPTEWLISSTVSIDQVNNLLDTEFSDEHYDTIGGFVFGLIGREPELNDTIEFESWEFVVTKLEKKIEQIRITKINKSHAKLEETYEKKGDS